MNTPPPVLESPEAVLTTLGRDGKRRWMYPTPSKGSKYRARQVLGWALIAFFVGLPWVKIGGRPAILLDIAAREFTFFGLTLHPTDTLLLMVFLLTVLLSVFFVTALFGRVWCGWGCPQTVYLEFVYRPIERLIEGKEGARRKLDQGPWTREKMIRKGLKYGVFLLISLFLAHTFVAYFVGWERLLEWMGKSPAEAPGYFVMMILTTALVYFDFGFFREQMCTITCPYARFQSVLMDRNSLIVSYDPNRGEPRGTARARKQAGPLNLEDGTVSFGDCVDCGACVRTCPTGIDIREGLQMECVACTQCIDACNEIMDAVDKPRGLIRFTSENALDQKPTRVARPRVLAYGVILVLLSATFVGLVINRGPLEVDLARASGTTYQITNDGDVANRLRFRLRNRTAEEVHAEVRVVSPEAASVQVVGQHPILLPAGDPVRIEVWITMPPEEMPSGGMPLTLELVVDGEVWATPSIGLMGPQ